MIRSWLVFKFTKVADYSRVHAVAKPQSDVNRKWIFLDNRPRKVRSGRVTNFGRSDTRLGRLSLPCCYQDEPVSVAPPSPLARQPRWEGSAGSPARRSRHRVNLPPTDSRYLTRDGDAPSTQGPSSPTRRGRHHHQTNLGLDASSSLGALSTRAGSPGAARPARAAHSWGGWVVILVCGLSGVIC